MRIVPWRDHRWVCAARSELFNRPHSEQARGRVLGRRERPGRTSNVISTKSLSSSGEEQLTPGRCGGEGGGDGLKKKTLLPVVSGTPTSRSTADICMAASQTGGSERVMERADDK